MENDPTKEKIGSLRTLELKKEVDGLRKKLGEKS